MKRWALVGAIVAGCQPAPAVEAPATPAPAQSEAPRTVAPPPPSALPAMPGTPDAEAIFRTYRDGGFVKINPRPVPGTSAHGHRPLDLWVDKADAILYQKGFYGDMPPGTIVVKVSVEDDMVRALMAKLPRGTDPEARDWYYYERFDNRVIAPGPGGGYCNACHARSEATDRLLGLEVFAQ